jgi:outer membrane biosynthesis protein TonB
MQVWAEKLRREGGPGVLLSVLLHGLLLLAVLWYVQSRPALMETSFRALPVELVIGGSMEQRASSAPAARLQRAPAHPESAPRPEGVSPKGTQQPEDELSAKLRALAQLKSADSPLPNADVSTMPGGAGSGDGEGNYALKDYIRAQILRRWLPDLSIAGARNMPVGLRLRLLKTGEIDEVTILDQARMHTDAIFHDMALSARNAALLASPIQIPGVRFDKTQVLTITLDPKAVLR